jgi:hypothetical protein
MGVNVIGGVAASAKTRYVASLTSGTSWTVPAGVNYVNVMCVGGGGGGHGNSDGGDGGTTTFSTISALGGKGAYASGAYNYYPSASGLNGANGNGAGGHCVFGGGQYGHSSFQARGQNGNVSYGTVNTTPGGSVTYSVGTGGGGGSAYHNNNGQTFYGGSGGAGRIDVEYWL